MRLLEGMFRMPNLTTDRFAPLFLAFLGLPRPLFKLFPGVVFTFGVFVLLNVGPLAHNGAQTSASNDTTGSHMPGSMVDEATFKMALSRTQGGESNLFQRERRMASDDICVRS